MIKLPEIFNVASVMVDRHVVEGRGAQIAIECGDQRVSYHGLLENTNRFGNVLRRLGVDLEQRVLLALLDSPEFLYCLFGAIKIGAVAVPVNPWLRAQDYGYLLNDTQARVAVVSEATLPEIQQLSRDRLRYLKEIVLVGKTNTEVANLSELMTEASPELQAEPTSKDDMAFWLYSSGSTGAPKGCVHHHHDMVVCSEAYAKGILRMSESDRCYSVARLFFAYGLGNAGYFPLYCGATTILSPARPTSSGIFADIERYRPTLFFSVPTNYAALLAHQRGDREEFDLPAFDMRFQPENHCQLRCLSDLSSALALKFSMLGDRLRLCKWCWQILLARLARDRVERSFRTTRRRLWMRTGLRSRKAKLDSCWLRRIRPVPATGINTKRTKRRLKATGFVRGISITRMRRDIFGMRAEPTTCSK